jgi:hypothetical protein
VDLSVGSDVLADHDIVEGDLSVHAGGLHDESSLGVGIFNVYREVAVVLTWVVLFSFFFLFFILLFLLLRGLLVIWKWLSIILK